MDDFATSSDTIATARWADPNYVADKFRYETGRFWLGRNPLNYAQEIGSPVDRHVFLCAETRSGKGRSIIINNLALWPGSIVSVDPKGENAETLAARRGRGDGACDGLGQHVFVLDPFETARVPEEYRAYFDPLEWLDPDDESLQAKAMRIADGLAVFNRDDATGSSWVKRGIRYIATLIMHVMTHPAYEGRRTLLTVRRLIVAGKSDDYRVLKRAYDEGHEKLRELGLPTAFDLLIREMMDNPACGGVIAERAISWEKATGGHDEMFESIRGNAEEQTEFLDEPKIQRVIAKGEYSRTLDLARIKTDPTGVSVFLCLPTADKEGFERWQKLLITLILDSCKDVKGAPATGSRVLVSVDEFLSFGRMEKLETGMTEIAGAGVVLFLAVQKIGPLKDFYKKSWETFISGAGLSIWFAPEGHETPRFISHLLGQTEVVKTARNRTTGETQNFTTSVAHQEGESWNASETVAEGTNWSRGTNWQNSRNWGASEGRHAGRNFGPHIFFQPFRRSTNYGSNEGANRGRGRAHGGNKTHGGSHQESKTTGSGGSRSTTETESRANGYSIGQGEAEQFFKRPLLTVDEARVFLADRSSDDAHPAFPGLALVVAAGEPPFVVRKCLYDRDPAFIRRFSPSSDHPFVGMDDQPMLEFMYTDEHYFDFTLPSDLQEHGYAVRPVGIGVGQTVASEAVYAEVLGPVNGDAVFNSSGQLDRTRAANLTDAKRARIGEVKAVASLTLTALRDEENENSEIVHTVRRAGRSPMPIAPAKRQNAELVGRARAHLEDLRSEFSEALRTRREAEEQAAKAKAARDQAQREDLQKVAGVIVAGLAAFGVLAGIFGELSRHAELRRLKNGGLVQVTIEPRSVKLTAGRFWMDFTTAHGDEVSAMLADVYAPHQVEWTWGVSDTSWPQVANWRTRRFGASGLWTNNSLARKRPEPEHIFNQQTNDAILSQARTTLENRQVECRFEANATDADTIYSAHCDTLRGRSVADMVLAINSVYLSKKRIASTTAPISSGTGWTATGR